MEWRAVGYGVFAGVVVVALQFAIAFAAPLERFPGLLAYVIVANQLLSIATYAVAGAVAGNYARRRGALHGALAGLGVALIGRALGAALNYARHGIDALRAAWSEPETIIVMLVISVAVAAVAGVVAARIVLRHAPAPQGRSP